MFTLPLRSNRNYLIVDFVFVAAGLYLPSLCLVMNVCSDVTILAFGRNVTVLWLKNLFESGHLERHGKMDTRIGLGKVISEGGKRMELSQCCHCVIQADSSVFAARDWFI